MRHGSQHSSYVQQAAVNRSTRAQLALRAGATGQAPSARLLFGSLRRIRSGTRSGTRSGLADGLAFTCSCAVSRRRGWVRRCTCRCTDRGWRSCYLIWQIPCHHLVLLSVAQEHDEIGCRWKLPMHLWPLHQIALRLHVARRRCVSVGGTLRVHIFLAQRAAHRLPPNGVLDCCGHHH